MHAGFLLTNGQKMSKSLKNFISIRDFLGQYSPDVLRMIVLQHHYRSPLDYKNELPLQAQESLQKIKEFLSKLDEYLIHGDSKNHNVLESIKKTRKEVLEAMDDDMNTPRLIALVFEIMKQNQTKLGIINTREAKALRMFIIETCKMVGLEFQNTIPRTIDDLRRKIDLLRRNKQFNQSDDLRKEIKSLGWITENTPSGTAVVEAIHSNAKDKPQTPPTRSRS